jgi:hypothetical protein
MDSETSKVEVELTATEKLAQFEKEKLSRRQALARIGFQAGAAAIAALTADELLRKVGKEMQRRAGDNKVAQQVAKEFVNAGVANAVPIEVPIEEDGIAKEPMPPGLAGCDGVDTGQYCRGQGGLHACWDCCDRMYRPDPPGPGLAGPCYSPIPTYGRLQCRSHC